MGTSVFSVCIYSAHSFLIKTSKYWIDVKYSAKELVHHHSTHSLLLQKAILELMHAAMCGLTVSFKVSKSAYTHTINQRLSLSRGLPQAINLVKQDVCWP